MGLVVEVNKKVKDIPHLRKCFELLSLLNARRFLHDVAPRSSFV